MRRGLIWLAAAAVLLYAGCCVALYAWQRALLYHPTPVSAPSAPVVLRLHRSGAEVLVSGQLRPGPEALIYFGGNAESVDARLPLLAETFPARSLFLLHYRGFSGSGGSPTEAALDDDALALFDVVHAKHPMVTILGRSLGTGVAVYVASRRPVAQLVLVTPYDSIASIAAAQYPLFPVDWLLLDRYDSCSRAPAIEAPTLLLTAAADQLIPAASSDRLARCFRAGIATMRVIPNVGHNDIVRAPEYALALRSLR